MCVNKLLVCFAGGYGTCKPSLGYIVDEDGSMPAVGLDLVSAICRVLS